jgi:glycosyltransferase involved in cell wall biosynthesis
MKISIVIPAYNEEKRVGKVLDELKKFKIPIIVVDDGSKDKTSNVSSQRGILVLRHRINLGKGAALKTGCTYAFSKGAEAVIMLDSDGQHPVDDLTKFVEKLETKEYEVILGFRSSGLGVPLDRYMGNKIASLVVKFLFGIYFADLICGYRAITREGFEKLNWESSGYGVETEMAVLIAKRRLKYCEVPVQTLYYDKFKGVTILDSFGVLFDVLKWRFFR